MAPPASQFVLFKGYHMGSLWLAERFSAMPGCALAFEYERCLRKKGEMRGGPNETADGLRRLPAGVESVPIRVRGLATSVELAQPSMTVRYLETTCGCDRRLNPNADKRETHTLSAAGQLVPSAAAGAGRDGTFCFGCEPGPAAPCRATGVSLASFSEPHLRHLAALAALQPRLRVVVLLRTNHVKHALSLLRTECGSQNHAFVSPTHASVSQTHAFVAARPSPRASSSASGKPRLVMRVPPHLLLFKTRLAGLANQRIAQVAENFAHSTGRGVTRYVAYEAMQLDMAGVLRDLLAALGAPPLERWQAARREAVQVKAGSENVSAAVSNFGELEAALRVSGCHRAMLLADRPIVFSPGGCSPDALPLALRELGARGRRMNRSEHCAWVGTIEGRRLQGLTRTTAVEATVLARSY